MNTRGFRRALLATAGILRLTMTALSLAPPGSPTLRAAGLALSAAAVLAGLLLFLSGIQVLHASARKGRPFGPSRSSAE